MRKKLKLFIMKKLLKLLGLTFLTMFLFMNVTLGQVNPFFIDVIQPDKNNIDWVIGDTYLISWTDNLTQNFDIVLYNGVDHTYQILVSDIPGTTWNWTIDPSLIAGSGYKIFVRSHVSPSVYYDSGRNFDLIYALPNSIKVLQPNVNGISWSWNSEHLISWTDNLDENVEVWLVNDTEGVDEELTPAGGVEGTTWIWEMGIYPESSEYKIFVKSTEHPDDVWDDSRRAFTITETSGTVQRIYQPNK